MSDADALSKIEANRDVVEELADSDLPCTDVAEAFLNIERGEPDE